MEIEDGRLLGQIAPALAVLVELQAEGGTVMSSAESDALGRFRLGVEGSGRFRLRVVREGAPPIETSWFTV